MRKKVERKEELIMKRKHLHAVILVVSFLLAAIQPAIAIDIPTNTSVGTWDETNRIYTLTTDVTEGLEIMEDNLTLDGDGHTVTGAGLGSGVHLSGRTGVTIQNLTVTGFYDGIRLSSSSKNFVTHNTVKSNRKAGIWLQSGSNNNSVTANTISDHTTKEYTPGIYIQHSSENTLTGNNVSDNGRGIWLDGSNNNELTNNTTSNNERGILLWGNNSYSNTLTGNSASNNSNGIWLDGSSGNILTGNTSSENNDDGICLIRANDNKVTDNTAWNNKSDGIWLDSSTGNTLTGNTVESNNERGIYLKKNSDYNKIYNNNFINNTTQANVSDSTGNVFNLDNPTGGNYWCNWCQPDDDGDGFVDSPYEFTDGQDNLPWVRQNGWLKQPPVADAGEDQIVYAWIDCFAEVTLDGSGSNDPDGDELTYLSYLWNWTEDDLTYEATGVNPIIDLPVGKHTIELIVNDEEEEDSEPDEVVIDVIGPMKGDLCVFPPFISRYGPLKKILAALCLPCAIPEDQIDTDQPILLYPGGIKPTCTEVKKFTWQDKQYTCVFATFDKPELMDATPDNGRVQLQLVGQIKTGQYFYGTDTVRIISWYWKRW